MKWTTLRRILKWAAEAFCFCSAGLVVLLAIAFHCRRQQFDDVVKLILGGANMLHRMFNQNSVPYKVWVKDMAYYNHLPRDPWTEETFQFKPWDDHAAQVCRLSMYVKWAEEVHTGIIMSPITDRKVTLPPEQRAEAYLDACREAMAGLSPDHRGILDRIDPVPPPWQWHLNVTHPWLSGRFTQPMFSGLDFLMGQHPGRASPEGSEERWSRDREAQAAALPSLEDRLKSFEELERKLPPRIVQGLRELKIRPVLDEEVEPEGISDALREGKTMVFDARKLCGPDIFNLTMPDIADLHGRLADDIPVFRLNSAGFGDNTYDTLREHGDRFRTWSDMGWQHYPELGPFPDPEEVRRRDLHITKSDWVTELTESLLTWYFRAPRETILKETRENLNLYRRSSSQTTVNVKRLPLFPLGDMYKALGSPSWIDRLWNLLWIGPVSDFWHFDETDNLLIAVSGNLYVAVMEQNVTDIVSGTRNVGLGFNNLIGFFYRRVAGHPHWVDFNPWIYKIPIHFLKLEPGMGITVPSRTYHNVMALDGNRILMNCFMFPKWRAGEDAPAVRNSWFTPGRQADAYRALWHLKARTLWRLWDTRRIGGFFAGYKLEFF